MMKLWKTPQIRDEIWPWKADEYVNFDILTECAYFLLSICAKSSFVPRPSCTYGGVGGGGGLGTRLR